MMFFFFYWICDDIKYRDKILGFKNLCSLIILTLQIDGETVETVADFIFGASKSLQMVTAAMKLKDAYSLERKLWPT